MYRYYSFNQEWFMQQYHKRSTLDVMYFKYVHIIFTAERTGVTGFLLNQLLVF